ncbi:DUF5919 domain-containing protein [Nocardia sp. NPDC004068]|uniref:helix-turn-helix domain-containing protein n=1 Tax=Nocardia sp. NPDC004068 TaxID=3364303 RepID=UPI0036C4B96D
MANERLRSALLQRGLTPQTAAESLGVDAKTVERWISRERIPYPKHRYALAALLQEPEGYLWPQPEPQRQYADVEAIFPTRAEFIQKMPPREILKSAETVDMMGLSLNLFCQQHSDSDTLRLLASGTIFRCLFLEPRGVHIRSREREEGHDADVLTKLTEINIASSQRLRTRIPADSPGAILIRTYDEPARFNITVIDKRTCIIQPYLHRARGVESPTLIARRSEQPGLFETFSQVFESMWATGKELGAK